MELDTIDFEEEDITVPQAVEPTSSTLFLSEGSGDEAVGFIVDESTGEIADVANLPQVELGFVVAAEWYAPIRTATLARIAGLKAEKTVHIDKINDRYDRKIKYQENLVKFLDGYYTPIFREYAAKVLKTVNAGKKTLTKTIQISGLKFSFRTKAAKLTPEVSFDTIEWLKTHVDPTGETGVWRLEPNVLVSKLPVDVKAQLIQDAKVYATIDSLDPVEDSETIEELKEQLNFKDGAPFSYTPDEEEFKIN